MVEIRASVCPILPQTHSREHLRSINLDLMVHCPSLSLKSIAFLEKESAGTLGWDLLGGGEWAE